MPKQCGAEPDCETRSVKSMIKSLASSIVRQASALLAKGKPQVARFSQDPALFEHPARKCNTVESLLAEDSVDAYNLARWMIKIDPCHPACAAVEAAGKRWGQQAKRFPPRSPPALAYAIHNGMYRAVTIGPDYSMSQAAMRGVCQIWAHIRLGRLRLRGIAGGCRRRTFSETSPRSQSRPSSLHIDRPRQLPLSNW